MIDNKDRLIIMYVRSKEDFAQYQIANAVLSYICANSGVMNNGITFVDNYVDVEK